MDANTWIAFLILTLILLAVALIALRILRKPKDDPDPANQGKHPRGYWMGIGLSLGVALGAALGPVFDNPGAGIGIGIAIGSGIGASLEQRHKNDLRPLTDQERIRQKRSILVGLAIMVIMMIALAILVFLRIR